jgi:photosystem I P700 chlorophyll a apoprotein A2
VFAAHQAQLSIIFLWSSIPLIQIAWQGDFEQWVTNPGVTPVAHSIRDPHFGASGVTAFGAQIVCTTGLYEWYYTIGLRTSSQCLVAASFLVVLSALFMAAGIIHAASADTFQQPRTRILSAGDSFINHHLGGFLGTASLAWAGHLVHVAIPREPRAKHQLVQSTAPVTTSCGLEAICLPGLGHLQQQRGPVEPCVWDRRCFCRD